MSKHSERVILSILKLIIEDDHLSGAKISEKLGISNNVVYMYMSHLHALGLITVYVNEHGARGLYTVTEYGKLCPAINKKLEE